MGRFSLVSLGLLAVALSPKGAEGTCPNDWLKGSVLCYKVFEEKKTWNDAERTCRKHKPGCHLTSIHSRAESADLAEYISDYFQNLGNVWVGLNDPMKKRRWEWTDRSSIKYNAWAPGQPSKVQAKEFCTELLENTAYMKWNDYNCTTLNAFVCQCNY